MSTVPMVQPSLLKKISHRLNYRNSGLTNRFKRQDAIFKLLTTLSAFIVFIIMTGIFIELLRQSQPAIKEFGFGFLFSESWNPVIQDFGALSSIFGTFISTIIAMVIAVPLSIVIALFLVEIAHPTISKVVGYAIELLAAIPSIVFGMWGLFVFAPFMANYIQPFLQNTLGFLPLFQGPPMGIGMLTAGIILALMILPFISAVMRDIFTMVPPVVKESAFGVGATTWEVTKKVTLRYGAGGLVGATILGLGRAIGETMAVTYVIGNKHKISASLFQSGNSIPSTIANEFTESMTQPIYQSSLMELGLILFLITLVIQIAAHLWLKKLRKTIGSRL